MTQLQELIESGKVIPQLGILPLLAAAIPAAIGAVGSIVGSSQKNKQQKKQQDIQIQHDKDMAEISHQNQLDMAKKTYDLTNAKAQKATLEEAGLNPALMYGGGGGGGTSVSTGAGASASNVQQDTAEPFTGMGLQLQQAALIAAQTKNVQADTAAKEVDTAKKAGIDTENAKADLKAKMFTNQLNDTIGINAILDKFVSEADISKTEAEKRNHDLNAWKAGVFGKDQSDSLNTPLAKKYNAEMETAVQQLKNAKIDGDVKQAELAIKNFQAELAKDGIAPDSDAVTKTLITLFKKSGLLEWMMKAIK